MLNIDLLISGLSAVAPLLATAIPLGIDNFCEGMTNVESAAVAGDNYNLRSVLLADGTGAVVGAALGSPCADQAAVNRPDAGLVGTEPSDLHEDQSKPLRPKGGVRSDRVDAGRAEQHAWRR